MKISLDYVTKRARSANKVVIVGAGLRGRELLNQLLADTSISITAFFDNNEKLQGSVVENIEVFPPYKMEEENCLYIIAVDAMNIREILREQLKALGICEKEIVNYYFYRDYDYLSTLDEKYYKNEIEAMYYEVLGKKINWQSPAAYTEIINWEKLNVKDERRTRLADKYLVREWVKEQIGEKYLTKSYGVWDNADEIDFDSLPDAFALKVNNGSGRNIIVKNKAELNYEEIRRQLNEWMKSNFAYMSIELHYRDIVPKIICEEYLDGLAENVYDYNIYCFHGKPQYVHCIKASHRPGWSGSFYDKDWVMQPFSYGCPKDPVLAPKPEKLEEMMELSKILSKDFKHVRVDWYNLPDGRVLFGEMTFSAWSGLGEFCPEEYDVIFGNLIKNA